MTKYLIAIENVYAGWKVTVENEKGVRASSISDFRFWAIYKAIKKLDNLIDGNPNTAESIKFPQKWRKPVSAIPEDTET